MPFAEKFIYIFQILQTSRKKITVTLELRELNDMFSDISDITVELDETVITEFCII